jgi:hypothetical protein
VSAPAGEDLRELERELTVAAESGEPMTLAAVQESLGVGHDDAVGALETLREHGKAVEVAPGEWSGPTQDELDAAAASSVEATPRVVVRADVPEEAEDVPRRARAPAGAEGILTLAEPTVRLTMAIAEALDADAIGKLVKAAIAGTEAGEVFILEITP